MGSNTETVETSSHSASFNSLPVGWKGITPQKFIDGGPISPADIDEDDIKYCMMDVETLAVALLRFRNSTDNSVVSIQGQSNFPTTARPYIVSGVRCHGRYWAAHDEEG